MKIFMDKDFLLSTDTARVLYHDHAAGMPIIDYHCHINPVENGEYPADMDTLAGLVKDISYGNTARYFGF